MSHYFTSAAADDFFAFFMMAFPSLATLFFIASLKSIASFFEKLSITFVCFLDKGDTPYFDAVVWIASDNDWRISVLVILLDIIEKDSPKTRDCYLNM